MGDFPSTVPVLPAAQAVDDRPYADERRPLKKRPSPAKPAPVEAPETDEPDDGQPKHTLDLDA